MVALSGVPGQRYAVPGRLVPALVPTSAPPPFDPATGFDWSEQPQAWNDGTPWLQTDPDAWTPLVTAAPVVQESLWDWDAQQDVDLSAGWPTADTGGEWVPVPGLTQATTAQQGALGLWDAQADRDTAAVWFQPDTEALGSPPITIPPTLPQLAGLWTESPAAWTDQTWFQPDTESWTPAPGLTQATAAQQPLHDWDSAQDVDLTVVWPTVDTGGEWVPQPPILRVAEQVGALQQPDPSEQADLTVVWPTVETGGEQPGVPIATPQQHPWQVDGLDEQVDRTQVWYQPEDDTLGLPPFARTTATVPQQAAANQQPDWSESAPNGQQWFAPEAEERYPYPIIPRPTIFHASWLQQPDWSESADRTIVWYQEPDDALAQRPTIPLTRLHVVASDSATETVAVADTAAAGLAVSDALATLITVGDSATSGLAVSDAATWTVAVSDS